MPPTFMKQDTDRLLRFEKIRNKKRQRDQITETPNSQLAE